MQISRILKSKLYFWMNELSMTVWLHGNTGCQKYFPINRKIFQNTRNIGISSQTLYVNLLSTQTRYNVEFKASKTNLCLLCSLTLFREFRIVGSWVIELLRLSLKLTLFRWTCLRSKDDPKDRSLDFKPCFDSKGSNRKSGLVFCRWGRFSSLRVGWLQPLNLSLKLSSMKCLNSMSW